MSSASEGVSDWSNQGDGGVKNSPTCLLTHSNPPCLLIHPFRNLTKWQFHFIYQCEQLKKKSCIMKRRRKTYMKSAPGVELVAHLLLCSCVYCTCRCLCRVCLFCMMMPCPSRCRFTYRFVICSSTLCHWQHSPCQGFVPSSFWNATAWHRAWREKDGQNQKPAACFNLCAPLGLLLELCHTGS